MRASIIVYGIAYRIFRELSRNGVYITIIKYTLYREISENGFQGGAAHFIDGPSGNFSGLSRYRQAGGPRRTAIAHAIVLKSIQILDVTNLSGTNRIHAAFAAWSARKFKLMRGPFIQQRSNNGQETEKHLL